METSSVFDTKLSLFLNGVRAKIDAHWTSMGYTHGKPAIVTTDGHRYIRIVRDDGVQRSAWGFIDKSNGDVLKAAGWKVPAKHARGNIHHTEFALANCEYTGPKYLR